MSRRLKDVISKKARPEPKTAWSRVVLAIAPAAGLVLVLLLADSRSGLIARSADEARTTSPLVTSDKDMWRLTSMLGSDARILYYIQQECPPGTRVHVDYYPMNGSQVEEIAAGRLARFPLALWPEYPDKPPYDLILRVNFRLSLASKAPLGPGEELVLRGEAIDLIRPAARTGDEK